MLDSGQLDLCSRHTLAVDINIPFHHSATLRRMPHGNTMVHQTMISTDSSSMLVPRMSIAPSTTPILLFCFFFFAIIYAGEPN